MTNREWVNQLFETIDAMDTDAFCEFLTETGEFRYGSQPAVKGNEEVNKYVSGFFGMLKSISHSINDSWTVDDGATVFVNGEITYTLPNDAVINVPFLNQFYMVEDKVQKYHIFIDPEPLMSAVAAQ